MTNDTSRTYILIPSYEPDESLISLVKELKSLGFAVILVNDGSSEKFDYIFDQVKNDVNYLVQKPNKGKGQALRYGFTFANLNKNKYDFVITCDGDGQHAVEDILKLNQELIKNNCTIFGVRVFDETTPKRSRNGNFMSRLCRTMITKQYISDDQCGLRGFPISMMDELIQIRGDHYEYEMNVICTMQFKHFKYKEMTIQTIYLDDNASSHFSPALDTFRIQRVIWTYDLLALITFLLTIFGYLALQISTISLHWPLGPWLLGLWMLSFNTLCYFGLQCLVYPTIRTAKRLLAEGIFFSIKGSIAYIIFMFLTYLLNLWSPLSFFISLFLVCFLNFWIALLIYKIKIKHGK